MDYCSDSLRYKYKLLIRYICLAGNSNNLCVWQGASCSVALLMFNLQLERMYLLATSTLIIVDHKTDKRQILNCLCSQAHVRVNYSIGY